MTAVIIVLLMVAFFVVFQLLRGTLLRSVMTIFTVISATIVAFAFFESLAGLVISKSSTTRPSTMVPYWQPLAFLLLFIVSFAVLQAVASIIARKSIKLESLAEKVGCALCGVISGLIFAGVLITAMGMVPIKSIPYERFNSQNPNPENPTKSPMNTDGLVAGLFGLVSKGSLSGKTSFSVVHPSFIDEIFLNRISGDKTVPLVTPDNAVEIQRDASAWPAPADIKAADGTGITAKTGHDLTVVRVGIRRSGAAFSLSQLRLICNLRGSDPLKGAAINVYPTGYFVAQDSLATKKLSQKINVPKGNVKWVDFAFYVPNTHVPVLVAFKQNSIAQITKLLTAENAPPIKPF